MKNFLRISDVVTFKLEDAQIVKIQDDYAGAFKQDPQGEEHSSGMGFTSNQESNQPKGLQVRIAATHSGIITRNNGLYLPDRMKKGATSFTANYDKPVLLHHNDEADPVGRVIAASYIDTSGSIADKYKLAEGLVVRDHVGKERGIITDTLLQDFVNGKMSFDLQVDTVRTLLNDSLLEDETFEGLGHIQIIANITDLDAIQKLLDKRYLTGSVGATTDKAVCSICKQDWTEEGRCDHSPGAVYDGAKCFIIAGNLLYDEYSLVNVPADRHSRVLQLNYNGIQDNIEITNHGKVCNVCVNFPQYISDSKETNMKVTDKTTEDNSIEDTTSDSETSSNNTQTTDSSDLQNTTEDTTEEVDPVAKLLNSTELTLEEEKQLYTLVWQEIENSFQEGKFTLEQLGIKDLVDIKLSDEQLDNLPQSSFCGEGRSFPITNCAHIIASRSLLDKYEGDKTNITKNLDRKYKALGCNSTAVVDTFAHSQIMHLIVSVLEENSYTLNNAKLDPALNENEVKSLQLILKRVAGLVGVDAFIQALTDIKLLDTVKPDQKLIDEVVSHEETIGNLRDELTALRSEYHALYNDLETLQDKLIDGQKTVRDNKERELLTLTMLRDKKADKKDFTLLSDDAIDTELAKLINEVDMVKIIDKLDDGMSRKPEGSVEDPTVIQDSMKTTIQDLEAIQAHHLYLKFMKGDKAASAFIRDMQKEGKLPKDNQE